jgi:alkylation response protein AidB-like acyl-CoA dehydrogenase
MTTLLDSPPLKALPMPRDTALLVTELRRRGQAGELNLPLPGRGETRQRWAALAAFGRCDLALARLAEGHVDALAILAEAGREAATDALYGVWAARAGGTGARLVRDGAALRLTGTVRFCSGASVLDRALVAATAPEPDAEGWLIEVDLGAPGVVRDPDSWPALGMDATDSLDVTFTDVAVTEGMVIAEPGWYLRRRGFLLGGGGVAAVWLGGAMSGYDTVLAYLKNAAEPNAHQLAHLGALATALRSADTLLADSAKTLDAEPDLDPSEIISVCRAEAERVGRQVVDIAPRITGPGLLCWDRRFAQHLADLQVYIRQHHGERDSAALGRYLLDREGSR